LIAAVLLFAADGAETETATPGVDFARDIEPLLQRACAPCHGTGYAGGGLSLALSGDLVVAAESARFTMAYSKIAAPPDGSSSYFLPRLIGLRRTLELYLTNRVLSAREALEWGLVTKVVPDAELRASVSGLAGELGLGPTLAIAAAKRLFHQSTHESLETQMELESQAIAAAGHTEDFREGVTAFAAKRTPAFKGR